MQSAEYKRSCLLLALRRYSNAVHDMEQTVLLPSLLRDVSSDDKEWDCEAPDGSVKDLYDTYVMLKSMRNTVESGLFPLEGLQAKANTSLNKTMEHLMDDNPETLFNFHLRGLFSVMGLLTNKSQNVIDKYMDIIGVSH
ncbi:thyroid hormone-inducible hepatic protein [Aplochiton taeniatus]